MGASTIGVSMCVAKRMITWSVKCFERSEDGRVHFPLSQSEIERLVHCFDASFTLLSLAHIL